jgi:hypothetical protein
VFDIDFILLTRPDAVDEGVVSICCPEPEEEAVIVIGVTKSV